MKTESNIPPAGDEAVYWLRPMVCTTAGLVGNLLLSGIKLAVGMLAGSAALVADGFHSLADVMSDIGILLALKASSRPPDKNHPYGHHSFETLGALLVAAFMLVTAFLIARDAVRNLLTADFLDPGLAALVATLFAVAAKELMARYTRRAGLLHNSPALLANATMHRSDAISSLAAAVGIAGAMLGWRFLDSVGALVISLFILRMGWDLMRENVMTLMDTMPDEELVRSIKDATLDVACVQEVRSLHVRQRGSWYLADLRIAVRPQMTIAAAHDVAHEVEDRVRGEVAKVTRVFVHVEPGVDASTRDCPES